MCGQRGWESDSVLSQAASFFGPHMECPDWKAPVSAAACRGIFFRVFYDHGGVDPIAIGRAVWVNLRTGSLAEGGSTLTQQLAKNLYFTQEKKFSRKVAEVFVAWELERRYDKGEILELYINTIYYGEGYYGIYQASQGYFGKAPADMTDYECTLLAGVPNAPSVYAPTVNPDLAAQRQRQVVDSLVDAGYITAGRAEEILQGGEAA